MNISLIKDVLKSFNYLPPTTLAMIVLMGLCKKALTPLIWHQKAKTSNGS